MKKCKKKCGEGGYYDDDPRPQYVCSECGRVFVPRSWRRRFKFKYMLAIILGLICGALALVGVL